ncbi:serine--tRNA ligase [Altererythrobacter sp. KTW20L]|uniref:serine--tRNA ligase n=1 Tax=Altererythrobacter sp. KTW20L TaxID=2942210 RepID=UPI0020C03CA5|nr:serine--tRNA ligase [Altererythrobacter sp. KTW20L]MCL6250907.1 serine--tRNA ligase [Altererythrobacter sp. KTW20L]
MHDIRLIRENPAAFDAALAKRGLDPLAASLVAMDEERRALSTRLQDLQGRRNEASKLIGQAMAQGDKDRAEALKAEVATIKTDMPALEEDERKAGKALDDLLAAIPNLPADDVPEGADEADNVEVGHWGTQRSFDFPPMEHADIGPLLGMEFDTGAKMSGARFTFLRGQMARLNRALGQFMLDMQTGQNGYVECAPPLLVKDEAVYGTNQLPKFAEDLFQTTSGHWLIPTAEVSLTNSVREQIIDDLSRPLRLTALTPCFRSEAGAAGRDTRGFIRQHQFDKVELVSICREEDWQAEHDHMVTSAESILQALGLPYRRVLLCTGDMGFGAKMTYDLEVWLPGQGAYREISSISWCGDFQARRMAARYRPEGGKGTAFVHTLNGSGLAVGRTLVAVLENYQQADGSIEVPAVLAPYMGGLDRLMPAA